MITGILGRKIKQSQQYTENGVRIPVTLVEAGPCTVLQIKTIEKDGYSAVQLGFGTKREKNLSKPALGHFKKAGVQTSLPRFLRELRLNEEALTTDGEALKLGTVIAAGDVLQPGDTIRVTGISKGKGFAGVVKRHGFSGGPRTHGQSDRERAPGSVGQGTTPGRVYKGKRMAGRSGTDQVTVRNLKVVTIDSEKNIIAIKGVIPGHTNSMVIISKE